MYWFLATTLGLLVSPSLAYQSPASTTFTPKAYVVGSNHCNEPPQSIQLNSSHPLTILDYGYEVAGYPIFVVESFKGKVQVEVKYAEDSSDLSRPFSDGPFSFAVGLTNTYRVETINITEVGRLQSFLAQGGQRWMSLRILTEGSVAFSKVGFVATISPFDKNNLPSTFSSSNAKYNEIWTLGPRAVGAACFVGEVYKAVWEITNKGALVRGSKSGLTYRGQDFVNYALQFDTMIQRGGAGWSMAYTLGSRFGGLQFNLVGNYPKETTFANVNRTLLPANSIVLGYGYDLVNQTTITSYYLQAFPLPFEIKEGTWYTVKASLSAGNNIAVQVNGKQVFKVSTDDYFTGSTGNITSGSFGFGGWQDQAAYFRSVSVTAANGTNIYKSNLTTDDTLEEYGVAANPKPVCLDGAKRDRLLWLGDFFHAAYIIGVSTYRQDYSAGTLETFLDWQVPSGQLPLNAPLGYPSSLTDIFASKGPSGELFYGLADYHILGLLAFVKHMQHFDDVNFATRTWSGWKLAVDFLVNQIDTSTGLVNLDPSWGSFTGPHNGSSVNGLAVEALHGLAQVATAVGDETSADTWRHAADTVSSAADKTFWNAYLGVYVDAPGGKDFSVCGIAFMISSGIASVSRTRSTLKKLEELKLWPGYKDSSSVNASSPVPVQISPNTNGFLLRALMQANATGQAKYLLDNLWSAMIVNDTTHSGASWEYVDTTGAPALGSYTSLSHPWGGAATYVLTEYAAGIRPLSLGYKTWRFEPTYAGLGLTNAEAKVTTPYGAIYVSWRVSNGKMQAKVSSPNGTSGSFVLNKSFSGSGKKDVIVQVQGGSTKVFDFDIYFE